MWEVSSRNCLGIRIRLRHNGQQRKADILVLNLKTGRIGNVQFCAGVLGIGHAIRFGILIDAADVNLHRLIAEVQQQCLADCIFGSCRLPKYCLTKRSDTTATRCRF